MAQKDRSQYGSALLMIVGVLALMIMFAAFAINAVRYYAFKHELKALATQVAAYAGTFLPNPKLAYQGAEQALLVLKSDFSSGSATRFPQNFTMKAYLNYPAINPPAYIKNARVLYAGERTQAFLPIKSMTIELETKYDVRFMNFAPLAGFASLMVSASATAQLTPSDVVLVIENSNSVVSPLELEDDDHKSEYGPFLTELNKRFGMWSDIYSTMSAEYGKLIMPRSKAILRARQCYGRITADIKKTALFLYDLLSASATFRVGVIHTLNPSGQFPVATIKIESNSYENPYTRIVTPPQPNTNHTLPEYAETRCAVLSGISGFTIPPHPLREVVDNTFYYKLFLESFPDSYFACDGKINQPDCPSDLAHLQFAPARALKLNPRELIWINNSGLSYEAGTLNPKGDLTQMQFAILRAVDMLRNAPKRADNLPVQKRVILVLTDGFEKPFSDSSAYNPDSTLSDTKFSRVEDLVKTGPDFTLQDLQYTFADSGLGSKIFENYCLNIVKGGQDLNLISALSGINKEQTSKNNTGIKLGILYYGARRPFPDGDMLIALRDLPGHLPTDPALAEFRNACNTSWGAIRGRFLAEASPLTSDATAGEKEIAASYFETLAPHVARALLSAEVIE